MATLSSYATHLLKNPATKIVNLYKDGKEYKGIYSSLGYWGIVEKNGKFIELLKTEWTEEGQPTFSSSEFQKHGYTL